MGIVNSRLLCTRMKDFLKFMRAGVKLLFSFFLFVFFFFFNLGQKTTSGGEAVPLHLEEKHVCKEQKCTQAELVPGARVNEQRPPGTIKQTNRHFNERCSRVG